MGAVNWILKTVFGQNAERSEGGAQHDPSKETQFMHFRAAGDGGEPAFQEFDPDTGTLLLSRRNNVYYWRGAELPGRPEIEKHEDGGRSITVTDPVDQKLMYRRHEDKHGQARDWGGEPALQWYIEGSEPEVRHYSDGKEVTKTAVESLPATPPKP